jgi:hypothetical protein
MLAAGYGTVTRLAARPQSTSTVAKIYQTLPPNQNQTAENYVERLLDGCGHGAASTG